MVYLKFLFNQWDCTNIPWIANNSLTMFSKAIRFGTIHILHQLGGSEKVQNYADVIYEWCIENIDYGYLMLSTSYLHSTYKPVSNSLFACRRAELLEIHIIDVFFLYIYFRVFFDNFFTYKQTSRYMKKIIIYLND